MHIHDCLFPGHTQHQESVSRLGIPGSLCCLEPLPRISGPPTPLGFLAGNWYCLSLWGDYKDQQTLRSSWSLSRCQAHPTCSHGLPESRLSVMMRGWALLPGSPGFKSLGDLIIYPSQPSSIDGLLLFQGVRCSQSMVLTQAAWVGSGDLLDMLFFPDLWAQELLVLKFLLGYSWSTTLC